MWTLFEHGKVKPGLIYGPIHPLHFSWWLGPLKDVGSPGDLDAVWVVGMNSRPLSDCMQEGKQGMISESSV